MEMKKYSILTYNFGNYEIMREPMVVDENCEYIYVTDNPNLKSNIWKIIVEDKFKNNSPYYKAFYVRYHPFEYVNTDTCVVIDASMKIKKNLNIVIDDFNKSNNDIALLLMPFHDNKPYIEISVWNKIQKRLSNIQTQLLYNFYHHYQMENYRGGIDAGFKIVKNNKLTNDFHNTIWEHILFLKGDKDICRLDQVVLALLLYKIFNNLNVMLFSRKWIQSPYIALCQHGSAKELTFNNINWNNQYFKDQPAKFYY